MNLFEFGDYQELPFDKEKLKQLKTYLNTVWQNRHVFYEETKTSHSSQQRMFDFDENQIRARNYVGFFRFEGVEMYVLPKIFATRPVPSPEACFKHILYYLSYSQRVRFPFSLTRTDSTPSLFVPEVCIFLFASYVENLLTEQPLQMYQERTEEMDFLRGQLAIDKYVKENIATGNWQKLHSRHTPLLYDNQFNQIVKYTARWLLSVTRYAPATERLQRILSLLQNVTNTPATYEDCLKVRLNDQQTPQQAVLDMCAMFLGNEMINYQVGQKYNFAFLLPMEQVYEDFVGGFLKKHFAHWQPKTQAKKYLAKNTAGKSAFAIQPDISIAKPALIADTKYKIRQAPFKNSKTAVDESDLYQMMAYALGNNCTNMVLLYPVSYGQQRASTPSESFTVASELLTTPLRIRAESIDITTTDTKNFPQQLEQNLKVQLEAIVFQDKV